MMTAILCAVAGLVVVVCELDFIVHIKRILDLEEREVEEIWH